MSLLLLLLLLLKSSRRCIYSRMDVTNGVATVAPIPITTITTIVVPTAVPMIMIAFYLSQIMITNTRNFCQKFAATLIARHFCESCCCLLLLLLLLLSCCCSSSVVRVASITSSSLLLSLCLWLHATATKAWLLLSLLLSLLSCNSWISVGVPITTS